MSTESENATTVVEPHAKKSGGNATKVVVLLAVVAAAFFAYHNYGDALSLDYLASKEAELRQYRQDNPVLVYGVAMAIYVLVTGLSLPGATILTLAYAWYFGFWQGMVVVSFASTSGATVAFVLSRYFLRDTFQRKFGDKLASFNEALEREGAFYLFTLRLIYGVPFFSINVLMGLTPIRIVTYWWVSQVGMLPGTAVIVYTGSQFPDLTTLAKDGASGVFTLPLILAFALLGVFPIVAKKVIARWKASNTAKAAS
ncbi:MAG: putative membrane protein YdjX (TVP38/TMEM64 family) [Planctomycetaceae bacterium]|jgi:uncharacterized membrane protein YdjX (TVP38/TMEM64 family)